MVLDRRSSFLNGGCRSDFIRNDDRLGDCHERQNIAQTRLTRHDVYWKEVKVQSDVPQSQAVELIKAAAYRTIDDPAQKLALFEAAEAIEKPKPSEYPLKPSTYGQENPGQN